MLVGFFCFNDATLFFTCSSASSGGWLWVLVTDMMLSSGPVMTEPVHREFLLFVHLQ